MSRKKVLEADGCLFGLPVLLPEWQARRNDARQQEMERTRALRAARLAAQDSAQTGPAKFKPKKDAEVIGRRSTAPRTAG